SPHPILRGARLSGRGYRRPSRKRQRAGSASSRGRRSPGRRRGEPPRPRPLRRRLCYGLLYHLENPLRALRNMADVCADLLLIETMVCDAEEPLLVLADETTSVNQALGGLAHRPTPSYLALALNRIGFDHVYIARHPPDHEDYQCTWLDNLDTAR